MEWSWQPKVMVVSVFSILTKRLTRVPQFRSVGVWCLAALVAGMLAGCAGRRAKAPPPVIAKPPVEAGPVEPSQQRLREAIRHYMGTDYKYGGASKQGLDCSGFVMKAYERAGIQIPRSSNQQYQYGRRVSPEELRYGDLVFFNNYCYSKYSYATASILAGVFPKKEEPCHVGIYIGDGRFIHSTASQHGVTVSNINSDCWKRSLIGVRRYLSQ